jgi:hypothetical protein
MRTAPSPRQLLDELSVRIYQPPLSSLREEPARLPEPLRVVTLLLDFDTEVTMQGLNGFLENSTGSSLTETIAAFEAIGAHQDAAVLTRIERIMTAHGVTTARLRADLQTLQHHQVTTWSETHGDSLRSMAEAIEREAEGLYLNDQTSERFPALLETYVAARLDELQTTLDDLAPPES